MLMNQKVPMSEMGKVRPVMTVERHEFKNRLIDLIPWPAQPGGHFGMDVV
jgi:hypothetical protein